jgi:hypothetical protein
MELETQAARRVQQGSTKALLGHLHVQVPAPVDIFVQKAASTQNLKIVVKVITVQQA